jgi:hypothetical protein
VGSREVGDGRKEVLGVAGTGEGNAESAILDRRSILKGWLGEGQTLSL